MFNPADIQVGVFIKTDGRIGVCSKGPAAFPIL